MDRQQACFAGSAQPLGSQSFGQTFRSLLFLTILVVPNACAPIGRPLPERDSGRDTAVDTGSKPDTLVDTAVSDVPSIETTPGEWTKVWPDRDITFATRPTDATPVKWLPCPSGRVGCEVMDTSWNPLEVSIRVSAEAHPQLWVDGTGYVYFYRRLGAELEVGPRELVVSNILTGQVMFVGREPKQPPEGKTYALAGLTANGIAYLATDQVRAAVVRQPYRRTATVQFLGRVLGGEGQPFWMQDTTILHRVEGVMAEITGDKIVTCGTSPGDSPHPLAGNTVLMMRDFLQVYELKCPTAKPIAIPNGGKRLGGFTVDTTTTPNQIVWVQGDFVADKYINTELWSAPISGESVDTTKSRKVANVRWGTLNMIAAHGYHATVVGLTEVQITRLSDGKQAIVEVETGRWASQVLALEKDHIWVITQPAKKGPDFTGAVRMAWSIP